MKQHSASSPGSRQRITQDFSDLTKVRPEKSLIEIRKRTGGRNNTGRVTSRFMGGGARQYYRLIDFKRNKLDIPGKVVSIEYDPVRSARIALVNYADGEKRYILQPVGLKVGQTVISSDQADILPGNSLTLGVIPMGTEIHNIELKPGAGGKIVRSAGMVAQLLGREGDYAQVRLPSGEVRAVHTACRATVGQVGNLEHENEVIGKAGANFHRGWKPHVRGTAMNPVDHPHGGGEGRTKGGRHPVTPWGIKTKGLKTRNNKRTNRFILKDRRVK